jgi:adenosylhomocysteine nucleosidase
MTVAVISALQTEIEVLIESLPSPQRGELAGWPTWQSRPGGHDVVVASAGLGKVNTAALTALLWQRHRPRLMIFSGVAGAVDPALSVGDVVFAERSIQHDAGVLTPEGLHLYQAGHIPFLNPTTELGYAPSPDLIAAARRTIEDTELTQVQGRVPRAVMGIIATGDQFLQDPTTRDRLQAQLGASAVEMEGAALAQFASRVGCDHMIIRSLSDRAGEQSSIDFGAYIDEVAVNSARLTSSLIGRFQEDDGDLPVGP